MTHTCSAQFFTPTGFVKPAHVFCPQAALRIFTVISASSAFMARALAELSSRFRSDALVIEPPSCSQAPGSLFTNATNSHLDCVALQVETHPHPQTDGVLSTRPRRESKTKIRFNLQVLEHVKQANILSSFRQTPSSFWIWVIDGELTRSGSSPRPITDVGGS